MAGKKTTGKIKTPHGDDMDYKVEKLKRKTVADVKTEKELKKKARKK